MLELVKITKVYKTGELKQKALDNVSLNFRRSEFVAVLGPSGSGKTTLLNIIGGLDHYTTGDLKINEVSTKDFKDSDWDAYRNHRVGFVFQSYNLIGHQTVLANVELALTISGVGRRERTRRAKEALREVGLEKHMSKRPAQLSGGQMQRVAIARALVNNPDIVLADEPTGALDSETSKQIMDLLKAVAEKRLVIMVTHNPELAKEYATRIVKLADGKIISDSKPYDGREDTKEELEIERKKSKKTAMSMRTALALSFNNLRTKKGRTLLTAFAGSIGIIGIALIMSLSNGIQTYINKTEEEALANYPIKIDKQALDMSALVATLMTAQDTGDYDDGMIHSANVMGNVLESMSGEVKANDLKAFGEYLQGAEGEAIREQALGIQYDWDETPKIFAEDGVTVVNPTTVLAALGMGTAGISSAYDQMMSNYNVFVRVADDGEGGQLRGVLERTYGLIAGRWPEKWNEMVVIVGADDTISDYSLYSMGVLDQKDLSTKFVQMTQGKQVSFDNTTYAPEDLLGLKYKLLLEDGTMEELNIVGVVRGGQELFSMGGVAYTGDLIEYMVGKNGGDLTDPDTVYIYPKDFDAKKEITRLIDEYNATLPEEDRLTYTDTVGVLMSSVSTIVDVVSTVLIAFVAISLVVSSIMIAIITYISVLERTKEIGILRAIGARKRDISRVFNAETLIEGLAAGVLGIAVTALLCIPANMIIESLIGVEGIAALPLMGAIILIVISVVLTMLAGFVPAVIASRKDPVEALRSE